MLARRYLLFSVRSSHERSPSSNTRAVIDFNFSAAPVDSEPCVVSLCLDNTGPVTAEWFVARASEGTPGDEKCVTEISRGGKNKEVRGQNLGFCFREK